MRNLDTVRLLHFSATPNNGTVSYSGVKGLRKHNKKKTGRRQSWGDAHTLFGVGIFLSGRVASEKTLCKNATLICVQSVGYIFFTDGSLIYGILALLPNMNA